jgi:hypothetical protein
LFPSTVDIYKCARTVPLKESSAAEEVHVGEIFSSTRNRTFYWSFNSAHKGLNKQRSGKKILKFCDIFIFLLLYSPLTVLGLQQKKLGAMYCCTDVKGQSKRFFAFDFFHKWVPPEPLAQYLKALGPGKSLNEKTGVKNLVGLSL